MSDKKYRILVVEDEALITEMLEEYFSMVAPDFELSFAKNLAEARQRLKSDAFDLCVVDCNLPDGTACDLFQEEIFRCPVIITTGYVDEQKFQQVRKLMQRPISLLPKPYLPADLYRKILELISKN